MQDTPADAERIHSAEILLEEKGNNNATSKYTTTSESVKCSANVDNELPFWSGSLGRPLRIGHNWADTWIKEEVNQETVHE